MGSRLGNCRHAFGVVVAASGEHPDFELLRAELGRNGSRVPFLNAFDVLEFDGRDLRASPWHERRATLTELLRNAGDGIRLSEQDRVDRHRKHDRDHLVGADELLFPVWWGGRRAAQSRRARLG